MLELIDHSFYQVIIGHNHSRGQTFYLFQKLESQLRGGGGEIDLVARGKGRVGRARARQRTGRLQWILRPSAQAAQRGGDGQAGLGTQRLRQGHQRLRHVKVGNRHHDEKDRGETGDQRATGDVAAEEGFLHEAARGQPAGGEAEHEQVRIFFRLVLILLNGPGNFSFGWGQ